MTMYTAQIVLTDLSAPELNEGMPCFALPNKYRTREGADIAAGEAIRQLRRPLGTAYWLIFDSAGNPV
jgi:hypothetical protein